MEECCVNRVHGIFEDLEPVTRIVVLASGHEAIACAGEAVVERKGWPFLRRPHVRKHYPVVLVNGIGAVTEPVLQSTGRWLAWGLEDRTVGVEQASVVDALDCCIGT